MLGKDGRIYDPLFDFDRDGKLDPGEFDLFHKHLMGEDDEVDDEDDDDLTIDDDFDSDEDNEELLDELEEAGLDAAELESMNWYDREVALEEAGLDADDFDDLW